MTEMEQIAKAYLEAVIKMRRVDRTTLGGRYAYRYHDGLTDGLRQALDLVGCEWAHKVTQFAINWVQPDGCRLHGVCEYEEHHGCRQPCTDGAWWTFQNPEGIYLSVHHRGDNDE
jgi:hypothetical protein